MRLADILPLNTSKHFHSIILACLLLTACGGGGGDSGTNTNSAASTSSPAAASAPAVASDSTVVSPTTPATPTTPDPASTPTEASAPVAASTPTPVYARIAPTGSIFYGMNGHVNTVSAYTASTPQQQLAQLKDLGVTLYRNDIRTVDGAVNTANIAQMMQASGVTIYPVILLSLNYPDEATAYQAAYTFAQQVVAVQKYAYYEVTNELAAQCLNGWPDGADPTDFRNDCFQIARGVVRGMIDAIRAADPDGKIIIGGNTWMHFGFDVMLWNGTQPDGTSGHPPVRWDITAWHWYSEQGDIRHACGTNCYDVIGTLASFGKPIWINEVGMRPSFPGTLEEAGTFLANDMLGALLAIAPQYDIESLQVYQLYDDPPGGEGPYGIMLNDGTTPKPAFADVKNFIANNPR